MSGTLLEPLVRPGSVPLLQTISVIFPIAGRADGETFRPFDTISGEMLVQRALRTFEPFRRQILRVVFIYLDEQEQRYDVSTRLGEIAIDFPCETIRLDRRTAGPADTVARGVLQAGLTGPAIVCDMDHRLALQPFVDALTAAPEASSHVCVWPLKGEDLKRWSVACVSRAGEVRQVADRRLPDGSGDFMGVIGCYAFRDIGSVAADCVEHGFTRYSAWMNREAALGRPTRAVRLEQAEFFGDAQRIREIETGAAAFRGTIFCDIDGTIFEHEDVPSYAALPRVIAGSREQLQRWVAEGYCVVLCTARASADEPRLADALRRLDIPHHRLLSGLPSGPRVLINDRKPSVMFMAQALSLEIARDQGLDGLQLPSARQPHVVKRFEGGSFAETLLLESDDRWFVRKRTGKHKNLAAGYARLKNQYRMMERFALLAPEIIPAVFHEEDNSHEYFYDMEYLDSHVQLCDVAPERATSALNTLFDQMNRSIYNHRSRNPSLGEDWFLRHLNQKIYTKIDALAENARLRPLLIGDGVTIDGVHQPSLETLLLELSRPEVMRPFLPEFLSIVHGDLTFQNIMVGPERSVKAIDMESSLSLDAVELDLGKLFQSVHSGYDEWSLVRWDLCAASGDGIALSFQPRVADADLLGSVRERWSDTLDCSGDLVDLKGGFYLGLHLVRMVPFRLAVSVDQALYALSTALQWISRSIERAKSS